MVSDKYLGLVEALGEFYPEAKWQRCMVHWYRNVFTEVPKAKVKAVAAMLKAIHAQEDRQAARRKAEDVAEKLEAMKLSKAARVVREPPVPRVTLKSNVRTLTDATRWPWPTKKASGLLPSH